MSEEEFLHDQESDCFEENERLRAQLLIAVSAPENHHKEWADRGICLAECSRTCRALAQINLVRTKSARTAWVNVNISETGKIDASDYQPLYGDEYKGLLIIFGKLDKNGNG